MSLYQKYRPKTLSEVHSNRLTIEAIEALTELPHAILLTGQSGTGKTTLARIIATELLKCNEMDLKELNTADFRGIDSARDIIRQMSFKPVAGPVRVWILEEAHMQTREAQNSLLKALEDSPKHTYFILTTTDPQKLLKAILTRCSEFRMTPLSERALVKLMKEIVNKEKKEISDEVLEIIAKESLGSARSALVALEKVINLDASLQAKAVEKAMSESNQAIELCRALLQGTVWLLVKDIVKGLQEQECETVRRIVLGYCNSVLLSKDHPRAFEIIQELRYNTYDSGWPQLTASCYLLCKR